MLGVERAQGKKSWYQNLPGFVGVGITYFVVLIAWVFFRAPNLPDAMNYLGSMFGLGDGHAANQLVGGQIRTTYHLLSLATGAVITWFGIQTWDFTRVLTWPKTALITLLFLLGIGMLAATSFSPFIYFIF
jgi:alginate O-acetyltransferase complex protein AlgI